MEPGERLLAAGAGALRVFVDDIANGIARLATDVRDETGTAHLLVFIPGCVPVKLAVYATAPAGCCPTTPPRVSATGQGPFRYGFCEMPIGAPGAGPR